MIKQNGRKYMVVALVLLAVALVWWFASRGCESGDSDETAAVTTEAASAQREQFGAELEIPEGVPEEEPEKKRRRRAGPICRGALDATAIKRVIDGQPRQQVRACYERGLKQDNELEGSVNLLLTIGKGGNVTNVATRGTLNDSAVLRCMRNVARKWTFPRPEGGCVQTSIPFTLTPKR